jgi:peptidoglycan hydrolase-like protein with peptidoglycan-binding domain
VVNYKLYLKIKIASATMISQTPLLKRDMTGPKVSELQQKLKALGFQITVDANFEEETHSRVMEF